MKPTRPSRFSRLFRHFFTYARARTGALLCLFALAPAAGAGEAYYTGFSNFPTGDDTIIGVDGWLGSHSGLKLHGVMGEAQHGVLGIGNAAYLGGRAARISSTLANVNLRRPVLLDPVAIDQEIVTFQVVFGIKDSTQSANFRRDDFEFLIYNNSSQLLAGIQFDNSSLESGNPTRRIYRLSWSTQANNFQYFNTGYSFLPETLETLRLRINLLTNLWTAELGGLPLFEDIPFHSGTRTRTFGQVLCNMIVRNRYPLTNDIYPGDNYLLYDDYLIRTDPVSTQLLAARKTDGSVLLEWTEEAGYAYVVETSADLSQWTAVAATSHTASETGTASHTDVPPALPARRFYRVRRSLP